MACRCRRTPSAASQAPPTWYRSPDPEETFNKVTWKANLSYKFNDGLLAYGTVSTGFRGGGLNAVSEPFEPIPCLVRARHAHQLRGGRQGAAGERSVRLSAGCLLHQLEQHPGAADHRRRGVRLHRQRRAAPTSRAWSSSSPRARSSTSQPRSPARGRTPKVTEGATDEEIAANPTLCQIRRQGPERP